MAIHREKLSVTASTAGAGTATGPALIGKLYAIKVLLGTSTSVDVTVSTVNSDGLANQLVVTGVTASKMYYPRTLQHLDTSGADLATHCEPLLAGTIKLTLANAGSGKTASAIIYYGD
jgi:hypothetical protein